MKKLKKIFALVLLSFTSLMVFASGLFEVSNSTSNRSLNTNRVNSYDSAVALENEANKNISKLEFVYKFLLENYVDELDPETLYKGAMTGMFSSLDDPYSEYYEQDSSMGVEMQDTTTGSFGGIGVTITKPMHSTEDKPAYLEVTNVIKGSPSAKAGLQAGDFITEINDISTAEISMNEVLKNLRGKVGTKVNIRVLRQQSVSFNLTITRAKIEVPTVNYKKMDKEVGYIQLLEFNPNSEPRIREAYDQLTKQGCKKLILDLRYNGGGLLSAAIDVASFFLPSGEVVSTNGRMRNSVVTYNVDRYAKHMPTDVPVVVLINQNSASSAEILAGALKDNKRAILVGATSYGKGVVQLIYDLSKKEAFKFTSSRYYTPSGANINEIGIPPDYEILMPEIKENEADAMSRLYESGELDKFVKSKTNISSNEIRAFARKLHDKYNINLDVLLLIIKYRLDSYNDDLLLDMDFDPQLKKAFELLTTKDVNNLAQRTKTVLQLQEKNKTEKLN